jgi:hypothetical protein
MTEIIDRFLNITRFPVGRPPEFNGDSMTSCCRTTSTAKTSGLLG